MKIGIFGSTYQSGKINSIKRTFDQLHLLGAEIRIEENFYEYLSSQFGYSPKISGTINRSGLDIDIALSLGGDGTFLRTAALIGKKEIPILGINTGRLGFLADIDSAEIEDTLNELFKNAYRIEERNLLHLIMTPGNNDSFLYALNEIAVLKRDTSSMITIHTYLNDEYLTDYLADGLIIATPTGSTAYSMSVNGPIIIPQTKNIVLTPVAPHSLNVRPLVIPDDYTIDLDVETRSNNFLIALDGRSRTFPSGTKFKIKKTDFTTRLVKRFNHTFYQTLREKLKWGDDARKI